MPRLRLPALLLLAALSGTARAACNPVGTEECCTRVVDEECVAVDWPRPRGEAEAFQTSDGRAHFRLSEWAGSKTYQGIKIETWLPVEPRVFCPPERRTPFTGDIQTYVSWKMTQNGTVLAQGSGSEAVSPNPVSGVVLCSFTVRSYAGVCDSDEQAFQAVANFEKDQTIRAHLRVNPSNISPYRNVVPRYSTKPAGRPMLPCKFWIDQPLSEDLVICFSGSRIRFEPGTRQTLAMTLPAGQTELTFDISGQEWSDSMDDAPIVARKGSMAGPILAEDAATVLWVEPVSIKTKQDEPLFDSDIAKGNASNRELPRPPKIGVGFCSTSGGAVIGYVVELTGFVHPETFDQQLFFARDNIDEWFGAESDDPAVQLPVLPQSNFNIPRKPLASSDRGNDNAPVEFQQGVPCLTEGIIYDVDTPGWLQSFCNSVNPGVVVFLRYNFLQYVFVEPDISTSSRMRCSDDFSWHVRVTFRRFFSFPSIWTEIWNRPGHSEDNSAGPGFTTMAK